MSQRPLGIAVLGVLSLVALALTVANPWIVQGGSMEPAVPDGALVVADDVGPALSGYHRGDVVIMATPAAAPDVHLPAMLKRVVGVAGDHVRIAAGQVFVNGAPLDEPYLTAAELVGVPAAEHADLVIPAGTVYVLGDNRSHSRDSKSFGPVALSSLLGRVWFVVGAGHVGVPIGVPAAEAAPALP